LATNPHECKEGNSEVCENHPERSKHCSRGIFNELAGKATRGRVRTPKVPRLLYKTGLPASSISHEVLWSAIRLRIAFRVGSHFLLNFCANANAYSGGNAKSQCIGMPEADTRIVYIV